MLQTAKRNELFTQGLRRGQQVRIWGRDRHRGIAYVWRVSKMPEILHAKVSMWATDAKMK